MNNSCKVFSLAVFVSLQCFGMMRQSIGDTIRFKMFDGEQLHQVKNYDVDPILSKMTMHQLRSFLDQGCIIRAVKLDNGDYVLRTSVPGLGGGAGGAAAGVALGHIIVWGSCHTAAAVAGAFTGGAGTVAVETAMHLAGPAIEAAAMKLSIGLGILLAVATGPV